MKGNSPAIDRIAGGTRRLWNLKNVIIAGASFFVATGGSLEFTVDIDKNLERLGIDVIAT